MMQPIVVGLVVALAAAWLVWTLVGSLRRGAAGCGCGGCKQRHTCADAGKSECDLPQEKSE